MASYAIYSAASSAIGGTPPTYVTYAVWINPVGFPSSGQAGIFTCYYDAPTAYGDEIMIGVTSTSKGVMSVFDGALYSNIITTSTMSTGTWYHLAGWVKTTGAGRDGAVYFNGTQENYFAGPIKQVNNTLDTTRTRLSKPAVQGFNGHYAEMGIWSARLDDAEIAQLAKGASALLIRPNDIMAYWPFYGQNSTEPDRVGGTSLTTGAVNAQAHPRIYHGAPPLQFSGAGVNPFLLAGDPFSAGAL